MEISNKNIGQSARVFCFESMKGAATACEAQQLANYQVFAKPTHQPYADNQVVIWNSLQSYTLHQHRHSERGEESIANFRGLPRQRLTDYLLIRHFLSPMFC